LMAPIGWNAYVGKCGMFGVQTEDRGLDMNRSTLFGKSWFDGSTITRKMALLLCMTGLICLAAPKARADEEEKDPPTRVARISYIDGNVSMQPGGQGDWGSAARNRPMTIGDKLWVDKDSRAELQAGQASIHLGSMTALSFLNLDGNIIQMRLAEGSTNFRVRELREGDVYEVDAPNLAFMVKQAGAFRIDVDESGENARVTVIRGEGEVAAGGKTYPIHAGERGEFRGTENIESNIEHAPGPDGLDRWAAERDLKEDNSVSAKYVSRDMVGYSDLDDHGSWSEEPEYGHVWYPNEDEVSGDWAPYSTGSWNYVGPWGWTWVDYSPWGFAPFHYGRWAFIGARWGWCPGPYFGPPIYGPAFVGFFGGGFGFGVGWFPLGFGEPFFPWFRCGRGFRERINVRNTFIRNTNVFNTNVRNINFVNAHNARAVTVANRETFAHGQMINRGAFHVTEASLKGAKVTNSVGVKPTAHSSLGASNMKSHVSTPPSSVQNRSVMARTAPAAGASHMPVHTMNPRSFTAGRTGNAPVSGGAIRSNNGSFSAQGAAGNNSAMNPRQHELSQNRPPSAVSGNTRAGVGATNNTSRGRTWEAQGNSTDRGRAPAGFGNSNSPANGTTRPAQANRTDRPPWAGSSQTGAGAAPNGNRSYTPSQRTSPTYNNRGYTPQPRGNSAPPRTYSAPPRTYSAPSRSYPAPSRSYSAPSRSYSAPSHSNSAPSHSSGGGGGSRGGGGGSPHGGGSSSHGRP
jgi:hypothetical protein